MAGERMLVLYIEEDCCCAELEVEVDEVVMECGWEMECGEGAASEEGGWRCGEAPEGWNGGMAGVFEGGIDGFG